MYWYRKDSFVSENRLIGESRAARRSLSDMLLLSGNCYAAYAPRMEPTAPPLH